MQINHAMKSFSLLLNKILRQHAPAKRTDEHTGLKRSHMFKSLRTSPQQWHKLFILAGLSVLLSACAALKPPSPVSATSLANLSSSVNTEGGVLALVVTEASPMASYDTLLLKRINETDPKITGYTVKGERVPGTSNMMLFTGKLPAGRYTLRTISRHYSDTHYWATLPDESSLQVDITDKTVSDLGNLILLKEGLKQIRVARSQKEKTAFPYIEMTQSASVSQLKQLFPGRSGWVRESSTDAASYLLTRMASWGLNNPMTTVNQQLFAGTNLGRVLWRSPGAKWTTADLGMDNKISAAAPLPDGRIFVAAEPGAFHIWSPTTKKVETLSNTGIPSGTVIFADFFDGKGLFIVLESYHSLKILKTKSLNQIQWENVVSEETNVSIYGAHAVRDGSRIISHEDETLYIYDTDTHKLLTSKAPGRIEGISAYKNKIAMRCFRIFSTKNHITVDDGKTWTETNTSSSDSLMEFSPNGEVFVFSTEEGGMIKYSQDYGKTWLEHSRLPRSILAQAQFDAEQQFKIADGTLVMPFHPTHDAGATFIAGYDINSKKFSVERMASAQMAKQVIVDAIKDGATSKTKK